MMEAIVEGTRSGTGPTPTTRDVSIRSDDGAVMVIELADARGRFLLRVLPEIAFVRFLFGCCG